MNEVSIIPHQQLPHGVEVRTLTLADAMAAIPKLPNRSMKRRGDLESSLRTVAKIMGKQPAAISLDTAALSAALKGQPSRVYGLNQKRYQNVLADLKSVLRSMGIVSPRSKATSLQGPWAAVLDAAETKWERYRLSRFSAFCNGHGIAPAEVNDQTLDDYIAHQHQSDIIAKAPNRVSDAIRTLNRIAELRPDLGLRKLKLRQQSNQYRLPDTAFNSSFIDDLNHWCRAASCGDVSDVFADLDDSNENSTHSPAEPRRQSTIALRRDQILRAATALAITGRPVSTITSLRDLVDPFDTVKTIAKFHYGRRSGQATSGVFGIIEVLRQIAKYHARLDETAVRNITALRNRVRPKNLGLTTRNKERLRQLQDERQRAALLHLPGELLRQAAKVKSAGRRARLAACAAALEILIFCPLRISNLVQLRLDHHIRRAATGRRQMTHLVIPASETKNSSAVDWPIPATSLPILEAWMTTYRAAIAPPNSPWLFPGKDNGCRCISSLRNALEEEIARFTGAKVHPHLMRHFAATLYLRHNPGQFESVRRVLGHKSLKTTVDSYLPTESEAAARRFDDIVMKERAVTKLVAGSAFRRTSYAKGTRPNRAVNRKPAGLISNLPPNTGA